VPFTCRHCGCPGDHGIAISNSTGVTVAGITLMHVNGNKTPTLKKHLTDFPVLGLVFVFFSWGFGELGLSLEASIAIVV
jgi:hypothetical protein